MATDAASEVMKGKAREERSHNRDARCISIIRSPLLRGQSQYLGGLSHGPYIYFIPGHGKRLLVLDSRSDICYHVGPIWEGPYKWLRAASCAQSSKMYGLPCHSNHVLRIDPHLVERILEQQLIPSQQVAQDPPPPGRFFQTNEYEKDPDSLDWAVTLLEMPSQDCQEGETEEELTVLDVNATAASSSSPNKTESNESSSPTAPERYHKTTLSPHTRNRPWKYHGGVQSPASGLIFAAPQFATRVLCIDPRHDTVRFVGPILQGRYKYYGAVLGRDDCVYGIPQNATSVLRISPDGTRVSFHGDMRGPHKWHGGAGNFDQSRIYGVPCNADKVLQIGVPTSAAEEPQVALLGDATTVQTGRHRDDGKYKYLGAVSDKRGGVYFLPSGAERVLMVTPSGNAVRPVGPNLYQREDICQNKWQNGFSCGGEILYGIPLSGNSVLRIVPRLAEEEEEEEPEVTTFGYGTIPVGLSKWEGCVETSDGQVAYTVPDNCKGILKIMPHLDVDTTSATSNATTNDEQDSGDNHPQEGGGDKNGKQEDGKGHEDGNEKEETPQNHGSTTNDKCNGGEAPASETTTAATSPFAADTDNSSRDEKNEEKKEEHWTRLEVSNHDDHDDDGVPTLQYARGVPTVRSSAHRVRYSDAKSKGREKDQPHSMPRAGGSNKDKLDDNFTSCLPPSLRQVRILTVEPAVELRTAVTRLLQSPRLASERVGGWWGQEGGGGGGDSNNETLPPLEHFRVAPQSLRRGTHGGHCEETSRHLSEVVAADENFLRVFDDLVVSWILPHLQAEMAACGLLSRDKEVTFYYQRPPTLRLQPGPSLSVVLPHRDSIYGHQDGEVNFWVPLTDNERSGGTHLHVESEPDRGDYAAAPARVGQVVQFHGSYCRHYVPCNGSKYTRVSLDFRVGLDRWFDASWQMLGTQHDHERRRVTRKPLALHR